MFGKSFSFGVAAGVFSIGSEALCGLIQIPLLLKYLSDSEAGSWFLVLSLMPLLQVAQAGLGPVTVQRSAEAIATGNYSALAKLLQESRSATWLLVSGFALALAGIFFGYLQLAFRPSGQVAELAVAFLLFAMGMLVRVACTPYFFFANGKGKVGWDRLTQGAVAYVSVGLLFFILVFGLPIWALGFPYLFAQVIFGLCAISVFRRVYKSELPDSGPTRFDATVGWRFIWKSIGMMQLTIVSIVVTSADIWIIERFVGLDQVPTYTAHARIVMFLVLVSQLLPQMSYPHVATLWATGNDKLAFHTVVVGAAAAFAIYALSAAVVWTVGPWLFEVWLGPGRFLGDKIFLAMLAYGSLFVGTSAMVIPVFSTGTNPFRMSATVQGIAVIAAAIIGAKLDGIFGMAIGTIVSYLPTGAWMILQSMRAFKRRASNPTQHIQVTNENI